MLQFGDKMTLTDGRYSIPEGDYGRSIAFQLYDEADAKFNASTYTGYIKITDEDGDEVVTEISPSWSNQAQGTGSFSLTSTTALQSGRYFLECQLEKANTIRSFPCIHPIGITISAVGPRTA